MGLTGKPEARQRVNFAAKQSKLVKLLRCPFYRLGKWKLLLTKRISVADGIPINANVLGSQLGDGYVIQPYDNLIDRRALEVNTLFSLVVGWFCHSNNHAIFRRLTSVY
jgi:hypothetical protein